MLGRRDPFKPDYIPVYQSTGDGTFTDFLAFNSLYLGFRAHSLLQIPQLLLVFSAIRFVANVYVLLFGLISG